MVQYIDEETQEFLWLCEEHRPKPPNLHQTTQSSSPKILTKITSSEDPKYCTKILTDPLDPFFELEHLHKVIIEVIKNAVASGRNHFRNNDIREIAQQMHEHKNKFKNLCPYWGDNTQKVQFISIVKNQVHLYIHFLRLIVRYCIGKDFFFFFYFSKLISNYTRVSNFFFFLLLFSQR